MDSKELVRRAIRHNSPERIPVTNFIIDWVRWRNARTAKEVRELEQIVSILPDDSFCLDYESQEGYSNGLHSENNPDTILYDEWGVGWIYKNKVQVKLKSPMKDGWEKLGQMGKADPDDPNRFEKAKADIVNKKDKYVLARDFFTLFERMWFIRGMENILVDHILDYDNFKKLRDMIVEYNLKIIDHWIELGVDGIFFSDDWGTQKGLMINPSDWRRHYKTCYKELFEKVKSAGVDVWMHLDGNINEIIPDLIEVGLDVYNPVQNQVVDIHYLRKEYGGHLCFNGGVDVQKTLPFGTPKEIKHEVDSMVSVLGSSNGGLVMGASHTILPDTPLKNMEALMEAMVRHTGINKEVENPVNQKDR